MLSFSIWMGFEGEKLLPVADKGFSTGPLGESLPLLQKKIVYAERYMLSFSIWMGFEGEKLLPVADEGFSTGPLGESLPLLHKKEMILLSVKSSLFS